MCDLCDADAEKTDESAMSTLFPAIKASHVRILMENPDLSGVLLQGMDEAYARGYKDGIMAFAKIAIDVIE